MNELVDHPNPASSPAPKVSDPGRVRACDLYRVFSRAADEAAQAAVASGLALTLQFDPALREARLACPSTVARVVKTTISALLCMTRRGAVSLRAGIGPSGEHVTMAVSSLLEPSCQPNSQLFALAAEQARDLGGRLMVERQEARLILSLVFPAAPSPMTVLLIEADWTGRHQTMLALREAGFGVDVAEDGKTALSVTPGSAYVAVLADLYLEDDDTLQLVERIRAANRAAPVFALSRSGTAIAGWALARAGFAGILATPVAPQALRSLLASVEAAELEAVQQGERADEDGNGQDRDHGRTGSAGLRSA